MPELQLNGGSYQVEAPGTASLADVLRDQIGLTGTKIACNEGHCGACTVLVDGRRINACLALAIAHDGADVVTIEGVARGEALHPVQAAFIAHDGLQCGFCTPGMVMAATSLLTENPHPTEQQVREGLEGNFCRCTGYHNIVRAVLAAAGKLSGDDADTEVTA